jgi:co-chaperonin GroES (HSP10)
VNNTGVRPIGDQVMVRRVHAETMTTFLHLPDGAERWPTVGTVLDVGARVKTSEIVVGVRVLFKSRPASALIPDDREPGAQKEWERVIMLREDDILCILED